MTLCKVGSMIWVWFESVPQRFLWSENWSIVCVRILRDAAYWKSFMSLGVMALIRINVILRWSWWVLQELVVVKRASMVPESLWLALLLCDFPVLHILPFCDVGRRPSPEPNRCWCYILEPPVLWANIVFFMEYPASAFYYSNRKWANTLGILACLVIIDTPLCLIVMISISAGHSLCLECFSVSHILWISQTLPISIQVSIIFLSSLPCLDKTEIVCCNIPLFLHPHISTWFFFSNWQDLLLS